MQKDASPLERLASCIINLSENMSIRLSRDVVEDSELLRRVLGLLITLNLNVSNTDDRVNMACKVGNVKYIDTDTFECLRKLSAAHSNLLGDTEACVFAINMINFKELGRDASMTDEKDLDDTSRVHRAVEKILPVDVKEGGWDVTDSMRALLLCSMDGIKRKHAVTVYCKGRCDGVITDEDVQNIFESLVDVKTKACEFEGIVQYAFAKSTLSDYNGLKDVILRKQEARVASTRLLGCEENQGKRSTSRPSIRRALEKIPQLEGEVMQGFRGMCDQLCFSNLTSPLLKHTVYFILCQTHLFHAHEVMEKFLTSELLSNALDVEVNIPVAEDVAESIHYFSYTGRPFPELERFRTIFTNSYVDVSMRNLNLTQVFQLYLAIYQQPSIRKEVWKLLKPKGRNVASLTRDAELFSSKNPFAVESVLDALICCNK